MQVKTLWGPAVMAAAMALVVWATPTQEASAFCGFYVAGTDAKLFNNATMVVMMREGKRTVLSMQNNYEGPPRNFAMVVPVPVVLQKEHVKTLPNDLFDKIDRLASPRLVEYWEQDPCRQLLGQRAGGFGLGGTGRGGGGGTFGGLGDGTTVKVEARFDVKEYEIVILSARDSGGLERWLKQERYNIPTGASEALRPYIEQGLYFFVARINVKKVTFDEQGQAMLSPLRFHYDTDSFNLPVRLGLLNARGHQDLLVHILARGKRYEVANAPNVFIPTNLTVDKAAKGRFGAFYKALFEQTLEKTPGAVVTEYAWDASTCDPCPGPTLDSRDLMTLGLDVLHGDGKLPTRKVSVVKMDKLQLKGAMDKALVTRVLRRQKRRVGYCHQRALQLDPSLAGRLVAELKVSQEGRVVEAGLKGSTLKGKERKGMEECLVRMLKRLRFPTASGKGETKISQTLLFVSEEQPLDTFALSRGWTLTRLHARYDAQTLKDDLVFKEAPPAVGGRGMPVGEAGALKEQGARVVDQSVNNFQGRYVILHPWTGEMACQEPSRGIWGGPPAGQTKQTLTPGRTAFAPGGAQLASLVVVAGPGAAALRSVEGKRGSAGPADGADKETKAGEKVLAEPTPVAKADQEPQQEAPGSMEKPRGVGGCAQASSEAPVWGGLCLWLGALWWLGRRRRSR